MKWTHKAMAQNVISRLPSEASYELYYGVQRRFGALRRPVPISRLTAGVRTWNHIEAAGKDPRGTIIFEVGTGRVPLVPVALWLMGARAVVTVDLNPYLKPALVEDHLHYIAAHPNEVRAVFGARLDEGRFTTLLWLAARDDISVQALLDTCAIDYTAPADAAALSKPSGSVDIHTSYTTFEHIPRETIIAILREGSRVIKVDGLFVHRVDYSDHFSHSDGTITAINFLQFSEREWRRYAGNRYMYMNRLRHDDFLQLYAEAGHEVLMTEPDIDPFLIECIRGGRAPLHPDFADKDPETLATTGSWIVSRKVTQA